jgi:hypothetical protein
LDHTLDVKLRTYLFQVLLAELCWLSPVPEVEGRKLWTVWIFPQMLRKSLSLCLGWKMGHSARRKQIPRENLEVVSQSCYTCKCDLKLYSLDRFS